MSEDKLRNALRPGHRLHWYRIEKVLGQGGFGITYLAFDTNLDQHVAIKEYLPLELAVREGDFSVYPASQAQDERYRWGLDRFLAEARTLARFKHPAIVRVLSVFEANNTAYMVMEYQQGQSLQHILERRRTLPEGELLGLLGPLLEGLEVIHAQGFIHRDIKPPNLFVRRDGHPVLLDFGSARQALGEHTQTLTSVVSPGYAPFEQYYSKSDRQGPWTDIYGLGATLYRCISGVQPMAAIDRSEAILKAERDVFVSAHELGVGRYSSAFLAAVDCALEFNEKRRPQSVADWRGRFELDARSDAVPQAVTAPAAVDADRTRLSAVADDSFDVTTGAIFNSDVHVAGASDRRSEQSLPPAPAAGEGSKPLERSWLLRRPGALVLGVVALVVSAWLFGRAGLVPDLSVFDRDRRELERLISAGDRALAAGQIYTPGADGALALYAQAYRAAPGEPAAAQGLRQASEHLAEELRGAIAAHDIERAGTLLAQLAVVPREVYDAAPLHIELAGARAEAAERSRQAARVAEFLDAATLDVEAGRLTGNGTDNALAKYRAVQILEPGNAAAAAGVGALAARLAANAETALQQGDIDTAAGAIEQARLLDAEAPAYAELAARIDTARAAAGAAAARAADVEELLRAAAADIGAERLSSPAGNNALERYRQVLALEPGNATAERGIAQIHERYLAQASAALQGSDLSGAVALTAKARAVLPASPRADELERDIAALRQRLDEEAAEQRAAAAAAEVEAAAQARAETERKALEAEAERRRQQDAEATRLYEQAKREAEAKELGQAAERAAIDAVPRVALDFHGFDPKYNVHFVTPERVIAAVAPLFTAAGYTLVTRGDFHDAGRAWKNLKLVVYRLNVNENTATGLYSYAGSVNVFGADAMNASLPRLLRSDPLWTLGHNGLGPPTDLRWMLDHYAKMTRAFLAEQPLRRR